MRQRGLAPRSSAQTGFTLIELLVVIIIIAVLAAIAIPTYLGTRMKAQDSAAFTLVRNALTVAESANVEIQDYSQITTAELTAIEPSISWITGGVDLVDPTVPSISNVTAEARANEVNYFGQGRTTFDVAARSESDNLYGIEVRTTGMAAASYLKVKSIDGSTSEGW